MSLKAKFKITVDVLMTFGLLFAMGYQFWGDAAHEWVGVGMFVLFILHHILNRGWYKFLFKGKYTPMRILQTAINFLLLADMLALMYSGIIMSRHVFAFLPVDGGMSLARKLHILGAYWGYVLMSFHLGLHWNMFINMTKRKFKGSSKLSNILLFSAGLLIACRGAWVFIKRDLITYMLLQSEFVFLDYSEPLILFYLDYLAMTGLFIFIAHYAAKGLRRFGSKKN
ncbi:MAG: DUF4405 domain-containing protein [Clostridiales bacterium]|nr:DUF4405 domain-containing protein [Clostridiales bacterium]